MNTIDLHIHTTASDGTYTPTELVDYALKKKLTAIAITDHDTMRGIKEARDYIMKSDLPLELIPGMEMSTYGGGFSLGLHILALFIDKKDEEVDKIIDKIHNKIKHSSPTPQEGIKIITQNGGIPVLAHPKEYYLSMPQLDDMAGKLAAVGLQGIECIYPTHSPKEIGQLKEIASHHGLKITGGTDFHGSRKPSIDLGSGFGDMTIPYEIVDSFR